MDVSEAVLAQLEKVVALLKQEIADNDEDTVQVTQLGTGRTATVPVSEFTGMTKVENLSTGDNRFVSDGNAADTEATMRLHELSADTSPSDEEMNTMILDEDIFEIVSERIREVVPGLEFKEDGAFWTLRVAVEEIEQVKPNPSKMTTAEYGEEAHNQRNSEELSRLRQDARAELEQQGVTFRDEADEPGPLVRAMLLEERTTTEVTRTYGPAPRDDHPFFGNNYRGTRRRPRY